MSVPRFLTLSNQMGRHFLEHTFEHVARGRSFATSQSADLFRFFLGGDDLIHQFRFCLAVALVAPFSDTDQVAFAVHVSEKLRADSVVMAQVKNNDLDQALKADLPSKAVAAIAEAMSSHTSMATKLLSDESTRDLFLTVVYELLRKDAGADLFGSMNK